MEPWVAAVVLVISIPAIAKASDWFVRGACSIAEHFEIPDVVIGFTVVSFATTAPEFFVSVLASFHRDPGIAVGNALGSCLCNLGLVMALVGITHMIKVEKSSFRKWLLPLILFVILVFGLSYDGIFSSMDGGLTLALFSLYMYILIRDLLRNKPKREKKKAEEKSRSIVMHFIVGAAGVIIFSELLVLSGETIAIALGIPDVVIAITVVSVGTSLPELVTGIASIRQRKGSLSFGNIIGANLLDLAWVIPAAGLVNPLTIDNETLTLTFPFLLAYTTILLALIRKDLVFNRKKGILIFGLYIFYLFALMEVYGILNLI
jgi:cation:H+ antiporter